jgi:hypothetical protein
VLEQYCCIVSSVDRASVARNLTKALGNATKRGDNHGYWNRIQNSGIIVMAVFSSIFIFSI